MSDLGLPAMPPSQNKENYEGRPTKRKVRIYIWLAIGIGLLVNVVMGLFLDSQKILDALGRISFQVVALSFSAYMAVYIVDAIRLIIVGWRCGYKMDFGTCVLNSMVGGFFAHVTPLAMGGQPFQIYHLNKHGMGADMAANIILSRFVVNAMLLVAILLAGIPVVVDTADRIGGAAFAFYLGLGITIIFAFFFLLILVRPRILTILTGLVYRTWLGRLIGRISKKTDWQDRFITWIDSLRSQTRFLWKEGRLIMIFDILLNGLSIVLQTYAIWYPLHQIVSTDFSFIEVMITYIAVWQVVMYIPSPGASGGLEGMFVLIFSSLSGNAELTLVAVVVWRFSTYYLSLIPGAIGASAAMRTPKRILVSTFDRKVRTAGE